jgi:hypothetical protein
MSAAAQASQNLKASYSPDHSPARIQFPQGVVRSDPALLAQGLKALNTRMKGMSHEKKWREARETQAGCDRTFQPSTGTV